MKRILENIKDFCIDDGMNEFLRKIVEISNPDDAIKSLLEYLGQKFHCERTYIFEIDDKDRTCSNTYEWCNANIVPQQEILQKEPLETITAWIELFQINQCATIENLEEIKESQPLLYASLKPQGITSLVTSAIRKNGDLIGFIGVDNPREDQISTISEFLASVGYFISFVMDRRDMISKLEYLSYHDKLTGALNRNAFGELINEEIDAKSVGVVYCDISQLKTVNDNMGHERGDDLILEWYQIIHDAFSNYDIYRIGGDEFIVVCKNISHHLFTLAYHNLQEMISKNMHHMAIGNAWSDEKPFRINALVLKAEKEMYWDKSNYYNGLNPLNQNPIARKASHLYHDLYRDGEQTELNYFFKQNHFDPVIFFNSISMTDYFPFVGDLQSNLFYISDEMKEIFGFQSNVVLDLLNLWEKKISDPEELEIYRNDMKQIISKEKSKHDLRYKVKDKDGNDIWVHSHGMIKWNEDGTVPMFFSGGISSQEKNFVIDPITNFPREHGAIVKIRELQKKQPLITTIGFTLNNFSEINELRGRASSNAFLRSIANRLSQFFDSRINFYRLDGMKFIGVVLPSCLESVEQLVQQLKEVIGSIYYSNNVVVKFPCFLGVMTQNSEDANVQNMFVSMAALLNRAKHNPQEEFIMQSQQNLDSQKLKAQMTMEISKNVINGFENFRVVIQPTVKAKELSINSGEVLLRWKFEGRDIPPSAFIPILENNRLILQVGKWVFEQAVRTCKRANSYIHDFKLAVNVSYYQILDPDFLSFMEKILKKYELSGDKLILEITETHYDETPTKVREFVKSCQALGMEVAIDDFGDGYSSLAFLMKYPANIVKLDRSLIKEMSHSEDHINFISSIVFACHSFKKIVCAEGVETGEELEMISQTQCDLIQGYYFFRPLEIGNFYSLLPKLAISNTVEHFQNVISQA